MKKKNDPKPQDVLITTWRNRLEREKTETLYTLLAGRMSDWQRETIKELLRLRGEKV